jgi:hypothetical protein
VWRREGSWDHGGGGDLLDHGLRSYGSPFATSAASMDIGRRAGVTRGGADYDEERLGRL